MTKSAGYPDPEKGIRILPVVCTYRNELRLSVVRFFRNKA